MDIQNEAQARQRAQELRSFYKHFYSFVILNLFIFAVDFFTSPDHFWFYWVLLGTGIGVITHAWKTFGFFSVRNPFRNPFDQAWEDRKTKELLSKTH